MYAQLFIFMNNSMLLNESQDLVRLKKDLSELVDRPSDPKVRESLFCLRLDRWV